MLAIRKFETVRDNGMIHIDIPLEFGNRVEVLVLPVSEGVEVADAPMDTYFLSNAFKDDAEEDAVWQKYIKEKE